jgi:hypothetical protein
VSDQILSNRRRELEEAFFSKHNRQLIDQLRVKTDAAARRDHLIKESGIENPALLEELVGIGLDAGSLAALGLVPLLQVAWADGKVQPRERAALLEAAEKVGVKAGGPGYELLSGWLDREPEARLFQVWQDYVRTLREKMTKESFQTLHRVVVERATTVARAAGGILGVGSVWGTEKTVLHQIDSSFKK